MLRCDRIQILHPHCHRSITWHAPVTAWGEGNTSDLRTIRQTGTLKLLGEESPVKGAQPFVDRGSVVGIPEGVAGETVDLRRCVAESHHIVQIKVV